jgi:hypothetical protein
MPGQRPNAASAVQDLDEAIQHTSMVVFVLLWQLAGLAPDRRALYASPDQAVGDGARAGDHRRVRGARRPATSADCWAARTTAAQRCTAAHPVVIGAAPGAGVAANPHRRWRSRTRCKIKFAAHTPLPPS